ncbi:MAG: flagellar protein FlgN [Desulfitobacteriia bacterium]|jgi:flagellar biosynthesis/type III secretory pathway chaperone
MPTLLKFKENLSVQLKYLKELIELEQQKKRALTDNNIPEIELITAQEEKILLEITNLEENRLTSAEFFAQKIGKESKEITLSDIEAVYPELKPLRLELESAMGELKELNETNTNLLENAINLVNFTLQALTSDRQTTYSKPTDKAQGERGKVISFVDKSI